ncbi:MAG: hypothetical protein D6780_06985, partial [Candidatus Dadabacteria bacterium]
MPKVVEEAQVQQVNTQNEVSTSHSIRRLQSPSESIDHKAIEVAETLYNAMFRTGFFGLGTDEKAIFKALKGLPKEVLVEVERLYKEHYGRNLRADLRSELSGSDLRLAFELLNGSSKEVIEATALRRAVKGAGTDEDTIKNTLKNKSPEEIQEIKEQYHELFGRDLEADLKSDLSGADEQIVKALLQGDNITAAAVEIHSAIKGAGTNENKIKQQLTKLNREEIESLKKRYKELYGKDLVVALDNDLSGAEQDEIFAMLDKDEASASAARLRQAFEAWELDGTKESAIYRELQGKSREELIAIENAYKEKYGESLNERLRRELSGTELLKAELLLRQGHLTEAQELYFAMKGAGTNEEAVKKALQGKTKEEIEKIKREFKEFVKEVEGKDATLEEWLKSELSGRDEFEVKISLRGAPQTIEERISILEERVRFESGLGGKLAGIFTNSDNLMRQNLQKAKEALEQAKKDGIITEAEKKIIAKYLEFGNQDVKAFREVKDTVADTAATTAATLAATAAFLGTAGTAGIGMAALLAAGGGGLSYTGTKALVEGEAYDLQNIGLDSIIGTVEGMATVLSVGAGKVASAAARRLGHSLSRRLMGFLVEAGIDGGVSGALGGGVRTAVDKKAWREGVFEGIRNVLA